MIWNKEYIINDAGESVEAQTPIIISASRSTDIPAFYADWFIERWKKGYVKWKNPFNGTYLNVSFKKARVVVFWSKNPAPMLKHIDFLNENIKNYYFQYTLNDYDKEKYERLVPPVSARINTFKELSKKIGRERVIWRFDPLLLTEEIGVEELLRRLKFIGDQLKDYTNKLVISFADIKVYRKVEVNLKKDKIPFREFTPTTMIEVAKRIAELNKNWGFKIGTCAEQIGLSNYGIEKNKCVDDDLMIQLFSQDKVLMDFLGVEIKPPNLFSKEQIISKKKNLKDKGQRVECGCIISKDIGQYNTCPHECVYCYANTSKEEARKNYQNHKNNPSSETIV